MAIVHFNIMAATGRVGVESVNVIEGNAVRVTTIAQSSVNSTVSAAYRSSMIN